MKKINLGLDFDNTIVNYGNLFGNLAFSKKLITSKTLKDKETVKKYMILKGNEKNWTELQGEVYGKEILKAKPYPFFKKSLREIDSDKVNKLIISHKTLYPIRGKKYNLHSIATKWLIKNNFYNKDQYFQKENIFFEQTFEKKINKIKKMQCDIYVDDLKSVLLELPKSINKILFDPCFIETNNNNYKIIRSWNELKKYL
jgi:hypothetical protein